MLKFVAKKILDLLMFMFPGSMFHVANYVNMGGRVVAIKNNKKRKKQSPLTKKIEVLVKNIDTVKRQNKIILERTKAANDPIVNKKKRTIKAANLANLPDNLSMQRVIDFFYKENWLDRAELHVILTTLFANRRLSVLKEMLDQPIENLDQLYYFHRARFEHYCGKPYDTDEGMLEFYENIGKAVPGSRATINLATTQFCMTRNIVLLEKILRGLSRNEYNLITSTNWLGIFRLFKKENYNGDLTKYFSDFVGELRPEKRLFFYEAIVDFNKFSETGIPMFDNWRELLAYFENVITVDHKESKEVYSQRYTGPLKQIPVEKDYMDIRRDAQKLRELQTIILDALCQKKPFSMIRLGDGEAYAFETSIFGENWQKQFSEDNEIRELNWWGQNPDKGISDEIKKDVFESYVKANILGIPSVYRLIRDRGQPGTGCLSHRAKRGLVAVLNGTFNQLPSNQYTYTEERCHHIIFSEEFLSELIEAADRAVIVSCWSKQQLESQVLSKADHITISPHCKVNGGVIHEPLFANYKQVINEIDEVCGPGVVLLVGGGLIGKIFIERARSAGAVGLDVGSIFDYFVGRKTRSVADII